jgi:hypothetical protein
MSAPWQNLSSSPTPTEVMMAVFKKSKAKLKQHEDARASSGEEASTVNPDL